MVVMCNVSDFIRHGRGTPELSNATLLNIQDITSIEIQPHELLDLPSPWEADISRGSPNPRRSDSDTVSRAKSA